MPDSSLALSSQSIVRTHRGNEKWKFGSPAQAAIRIREFDHFKREIASIRRIPPMSIKSLASFAGQFSVLTQLNLHAVRAFKLPVRFRR